jgi:chemotaxis protein CheX
VRYVYIRPFVDSAQRVLEKVLSERAVPGEIVLSSAPVTSRGVTSIVGVTGEGEGRVLFDMSAQTALAISSVMNGRPQSELDDLARDSIAELAGMMTGTAVSALADDGHRLKVSPPTLVAGANVTISNLALETLIVPIETPLGEVVVNVAIATS